MISFEPVEWATGELRGKANVAVGAEIGYTDGFGWDWRGEVVWRDPETLDFRAILYRVPGVDR